MTSGAPSRPTTTCRRAGPGPSIRPSPGSSRTPRSSAASARTWRSPGRPHQGQGRPARAVHARHRRRADHPRSRRHPRARNVDGIKQAPIEGTSFAYTFDAKNAKAAVAAQDPVFRDDGPVGAVSRRLAAEHQGEPRAVGGLRRRQSRPAQQPGARTLRPEQGLQPVPEHRRQVSGQGEGDEEDVHRGSEEVSGLPDGRLGGRPHRGPASEHHRRPHRVRLHPAHGRPAAGRFAVPAQQLLHHHGGHRRARRAAPRA